MHVLHSPWVGARACPDSAAPPNVALLPSTRPFPTSQCSRCPAAACVLRRRVFSPEGCGRAPFPTSRCARRRRATFGCGRTPRACGAAARSASCRPSPPSRSGTPPPSTPAPPSRSAHALTGLLVTFHSSSNPCLYAFNSRDFRIPAFMPRGGYAGVCELQGRASIAPPRRPTLSRAP
jgi:hypothetical protein